MIRKPAIPVNDARFVKWQDTKHGLHRYEFRDYMRNVADTRYIIRRIQRIIDSCATDAGLEPLEHQALVQIYGARTSSTPVGQIAERLDIASSALASRLVNRLETLQLVKRARSATDKRTAVVSATVKGETLLHKIADNVHREVTYFQSKLTAEQQHSAMDIFAFYVGMKPLRRRRTRKSLL